jgi:UDP-N-acetylglucosamine--N-acetylmuramyl-(pentapeptide) pyrophosphoryl-undecaprenol N-acetylglucosamine transferase
MERFFPKDKLHFTGNPVRKEVIQLEGKRPRGFEHFDLDPSIPTVLVVGGSLGARSINQAIAGSLDQFVEASVQLIWQTGKAYWEKGQEEAKAYSDKGIRAVQFIKKMDFAYAAADLIVSRAGAIAVSELANIGKPVILVPSQNVAEDHQTKNALALVNHGAALMVKDIEVKETLWPKVSEVLGNSETQEQLSIKIRGLAKNDAAHTIAQEVLSMIK